ncbi:unnamed protein product [Amoebophrya sp. A25]|nr:unnamed protein product [Amoebophrya sp. A25]|eukprot:GSA25T00026983001.1
MMKEKRYEHWQTLVWNDYQTALTFSVFRPPGITLKAQTLQDTIKPECKRQILLYNESSTYGARGSYYTQHGWSRSEGGLGQSSEDERNQRDKEQFEDDVNSLIDNKIQPLVLESIKAQGYQDKHISRSADGMLHSPFFGDVQKKMQGIMEEKKYGHWQRLVWNRYHSALTFSAFREGITLNAQTLQDTIKPECLRLISETNEAPLGVRAYYYKQHGWSGGGFNSVAYQPSSSLLEHHATATVPTSHAALSNMHFEAMAVMQIMTTAFIAGLALGWCLRRRCDHRNQASSGAPELPKYGATAEGHCMEEC